MHNLPFELLLLTCVSLVFLFVGNSLRSFARDLLTVGKDCWTWTTRSGELFEDVEVEEIEAGEIVLKHKFGICRIAIDRLSERSRQLLYHTQKWSEYVSAGPEVGKVRSFASESSHAQAA